MESNSKLRRRAWHALPIEIDGSIVKRRYFVAFVNTEHKYVPELRDLCNAQRVLFNICVLESSTHIGGLCN